MHNTGHWEAPGKLDDGCRSSKGQHGCSVGEIWVSCIPGQVATEEFYENIAHLWSHH